jgi:SPP1 gp7 family putative phage head morphogenesis protein
MADNRTDPTKTTLIRRRFEAEAYKRFRRVKGRINDVVIKQDGFGLKLNQRFAFERTDKKIEAFMAWLKQMQRDEILTVREGTPQAAAARQAWTSKYVEAAYQKGVASAANNIRRSGGKVEQRWVDAAFRRPIHVDRAGLAYIRAYDQLEGITQAMDQQISRALAQGLAEGIGPQKIAQRMNERVDKIGITRARTLARTEVVSAHAQASLNAYEEAGIAGVEAQVEFTTAQDASVCPICEGLEGTVYTKEEARSIIPVHPNCRCAWLPVIDGASNIDLR